jgi:hypothetical protein
MYGSFTFSRGEAQHQGSITNGINNGGDWVHQHFTELEDILSQLPESIWQSHYITGDVLCVHAGIETDLSVAETSAFFDQDLFSLPA